MNKIFEARLTMAAIIFGLEEDLRIIINDLIIPGFSDLSFITNDDSLSKVIDRFGKENPDLDPTDFLSESLNFLDFGDSYQTILSNKSNIPLEAYKAIQRISKRLDEVIPIRNRVMHSRPLVTGDLEKISLIEDAIKTVPEFAWSRTKTVFKRLREDPSFVFSIRIPDYRDDNTNVLHNLPLPDFDETGFMGRSKDIKGLSTLMLNNSPVVTLLGDGGVGKSALMLKVAYDILDLGNACPYEMIIWTSAKATMLTANGVKEISNSIKDISGIISEISDELIGKTMSLDNDIDEILLYMKEFKILLIIDNLETILTNQIRDFIANASQYSKIAITSRIGLGEMEFRRKLFGFTPNESASFIRQLEQVRNIKILSKLDNAVLFKYSKMLHHNPLSLKWFVTAVDQGGDPNVIVSNQGELLHFCMSNVYNNLDSSSKKVLDIFVSTKRALNEAELMYVSEFKPIEVRKALNQLARTTLLSRYAHSENETVEMIHQVTPFAREYLVEYFPPKKSFVQSVKQKLKAISTDLESLEILKKYSEYDYLAISVRNNSEAVVAKMLREVLRTSKRITRRTGASETDPKFSEAMEKIENAISILPQYFEPYRIRAFIKVGADDVLGAETDYETALDIEPNNHRLRYFYSGFLIYQLDSAEDALPILKLLSEERPKSAEIRILYATAMLFTGEYIEAIKHYALIRTSPESGFRIRIISMSGEIGAHTRYAEHLATIEKDLSSAISEFKKGIEIYVDAYKNECYDSKSTNKFAKLISEYLYYTSKRINKDETENISKLIAYFSYELSQSYLWGTILERLMRNYDVLIDGGTELILRSSDISGFEARKKGVLLNFDPTKGYVFINTDDGDKIFAGKHEFRNPRYWHMLKRNQKVCFDLGKNQKDICAVNVTPYLE